LDARLLEEARTLLVAARSVAAFSGAGLSAESGISTFRGQEPDALWSRFDPMQLASIDGFRTDPERVVAWYSWRRAKLAAAAPNAAHAALARHSQLAHVTQNVDDLLERAGVPAERIHHLHGTIGRDHCNARCGYEEAVDLANAPPLRRCPDCLEYLRPAVVWFGERLPQRTWNEADATCRRVDCLLVIGTSGTVYPAAGLVEQARRHGSKIIVINTEPSEVGRDSGFDVELIGSAGTVLPRLLDGLSLRTA